MIFIAHRGNIHGPRPEYENMPYHIEEAIHLGYDVEIDLWSDGVQFRLGHDQPETLVDRSFLYKYIDKLWCHAKTPLTLATLLDLQMHCFFHVEDDVTLTSKNFIWTFPGESLTNRSIAVFDNRNTYSIKRLKKVSVVGICSDYIDDFKEFLK